MILLALGGNLGHPERLLDCARTALGLAGVQILRQSGVVATPALLPAGAPPSWDQPYVNQVIEVQTDQAPLDLLRSTQAVEVQLDRQSAARWAPRAIDVDILAIGTLVMRSDRLSLPHPQMHLRRFVLQPLCELVPQWLHPVLRCSATELLARLAP